MKITVKVKTRAKENKINSPKAKLFNEKDEMDFWEVSTKELPVQGRANSAVQRLLAEHFKTTTNRVVLLRGGTSKIKVFEIKDK